MLPRETLWPLLAAVAVVLTTVATGLHRVLAWPFRWAMEHLLYATLDRTKMRARVWLDALYADAIAERQRLASAVDATQRDVAALRTAIDTQGRSLASLPELSRNVERVADSLDRVTKEMSSLVADVKTHGEDVAHMRGRIDEWDGVERRTTQRRRPRA